MDSDGSGSLDFEEFMNALYVVGRPFNHLTLQDAFAFLDVHGLGIYIYR